jgi:iron-sulfur cluster assembly protein
VTGVQTCALPICFLYLLGTELDYSGGLNGKGFTFNNPNASRTCGCGESFSV